MGLLRRKPGAEKRAATATREAAVDASERVQGAAELTRETADRAAEKLHRKAVRARRKADSASRRAQKAGRKAERRTRRAAGSGTPATAAAAPGGTDRAQRSTDRKIARTVAKAEAGARKAEAKAAQAAEQSRQKSEDRAMKEAERERAAREWNAKRVQRYMSIAKVLAPVVAPYAMAAAGSLRHRLDDQRSRRLGVSPDELGGYSGPGGKLHARMSRISRTITELRQDGTVDRDPRAKRFTEETEPRLHDLAAAVRAAENMPAARRKAAFRTVSQDLDRIEVDLLDHLGIRA